MSVDHLLINENRYDGESRDSLGPLPVSYHIYNRTSHWQTTTLYTHGYIIASNRLHSSQSPSQTSFDVEPVCCPNCRSLPVESLHNTALNPILLRSTTSIDTKQLNFTKHGLTKESIARRIFVSVGSDNDQLVLDCIVAKCLDTTIRRTVLLRTRNSISISPTQHRVHSKRTNNMRRSRADN